MASGTLPNPPTPPPAPAGQLAPPSPHEEFIEEQLGATRMQVRLVEIASAVLTLLAAALGYLLVVAMIDHWILSLNVPLRMLALLALVAAAGWFIYQRIVPLLVRRINPIYAAHTIEQAEPSLKNSLVNFLMLRRQPEKLHHNVYQALGQRAATDLSHVPEDTAIDRSGLLRIAYVLVGVLAIAAAYKILSPKDPFQSVARVVAPWQNIARPSRVEIINVTPGDVELFQGDPLTIAATIDGLREGKDEAVVVYSTVDGQAIDRRVPLRLDSAGLTYEAEIASASEGIAQSLIYRIEAGDATTKDYRVEVQPAPTILVTKIQYNYPRYTKRSPEIVEGTGDINAIEGTLVTVYAKANREIDSALLEFDPIIAGAEPPARDTSQRLAIKHIDDRTAKVSFYLRMAKDGRTPWHHSFKLQFNTSDGHTSTRPIIHTINVKPDLPPLVEILQPTERRVQVPQNRAVEIEVRAVDHDFALRKVVLKGERDGANLLDEALLNSPDGHTGQAILKYSLTPEDLGLAVGEVLEYYAMAEDNRTAIRTERPAPNVARTRPMFQIEVTEPKAREDGATKDAPEDGEPEQGGEDGGEKMSGEGDSSDAGEEGEAGSESQGSDSDNQTEDGSAGEGGQPQEGGSAGSDGQPGQQPSEGDQNSQGGSSGTSGEPSDQASQSNDQTGQGGTPSGSPGGDSQSQPADGDNSSGGQSGQPSGGDQQGQPSDQPLSNDGSEDADAFERIQEHLRDKQQQAQGQNGGQQGDQTADNRNSQNGGQNDQGQPQGGGQQDNNQQGQPAGDNQQGDSGGAGSQDNQNNQGQSGEQNSGGGSEQQQGQKPQGGSAGEPMGGDAGSQDQQQQSGGQSGEQPSQGSGGEDGQKQKPQGGGESESQGGSPMGGKKPEGDQQQSGGEGQQPQGGSQNQQNDKPGGGQEGQSGGGSPESQAEKQQQDGQQKSGGGQQGGEKQEDGGKSPGNSEQGGDSQGESGGDRKGGGEEGGGQSSQQPGQDSDGSSSAADQGDGAANQSGDGETGNQAGNDQQAQGKTGNSGDQQGQGSSTGNVKDGNPQDNSSNEGQPRQDQQRGDGQSGEGSTSRDQQPSDQSGDPQSNQPGEGAGVPTGGGKPADNRPGAADLPKEMPAGEKAKLEYARKATDMVLENLKDQKHSPDPELLDKLGWSKDDLNKFINRWDQAQAAADKGGAEGDAARRRLDDSLRSLGLRPPAGRVEDAAPTLRPSGPSRDTGTRSRPPKGYADQYKAYTKSRNNRESP